MALSLSACSVNAFTAPRTSMISMSANKYATDAAPSGVQSWYDAGIRLNMAEMDGVVAPTAAAPAPEPEPVVEAAEVAPEPTPAPAAAATRLEVPWNPQSLDVSAVPELGPLALFKEQFVTENLKSAPTYLDGSMPGDKGFDPWGLIALARPNLDMDKTSRTGEARDATIASMSAEEQESALAWMRNAEVKHARLAMLASLGWVMAEKVSGSSLYFTTNGKAPSLFNGHLLDYALPLVVVFGGFAALEFLKKEEGGLGGDFGFDPLGFSTGQGPIPFDALPFEVPNVGDMTALKEAEIKNGRAAMMAITGFAVQEFIWGTPVVAQTPLFF